MKNKILLSGGCDLFYAIFNRKPAGNDPAPTQMKHQFLFETGTKAPNG
jgi:hypothetical protein